MIYMCGHKTRLEDTGIGCCFYSYSEDVLRRHMWEAHGFDINAQRLAAIEAKLDKILAERSPNGASTASSDADGGAA